MFESAGASITETARAVIRTPVLVTQMQFKMVMRHWPHVLAVKTQHQRQLSLSVHNGSVMRPVSNASGFSVARGNATAVRGSGKEAFAGKMYPFQVTKESSGIWRRDRLDGTI
jgi:hypothetical protein